MNDNIRAGTNIFVLYTIADAYGMKIYYRNIILMCNEL